MRRKKGNAPPLWAAVVILLCAIAYLLISQSAEPLPAPETTPPPLPINAELYVYMLDAGQGDAFLIKTGEFELLIDAGKNKTADAITEKLKTMVGGELEFAVGTHPDEDHIGGLDTVIDNFKVGTLLMPDRYSDTKTYGDVISAAGRAGLAVTNPKPLDKFPLGEAAVTVLAPVKNDYRATNNHSIVLRVDFGNTSFLFTGDAERESERDMLDYGAPLAADVLKAGHHGSSSSTSPDFLAAVNPKIALVSCGEGNSYGHPHEETMKRLEDAGVTVYRTDVNGAVTLISDGENIRVTTEK